MIEGERVRLSRTKGRTFSSGIFNSENGYPLCHPRYACVVDRIALLKLGLRGCEMDKDAMYERFKELYGHGGRRGQETRTREIAKVDECLPEMVERKVEAIAE
jgi:hypothetical protein